MKNRLTSHAHPTTKPFRWFPERSESPATGKPPAARVISVGKPQAAPLPEPTAAGTILVPVDLSERSRGLVRQAATLARRMSVDLVLLHVHDRYEYASACISCDRFRQTNEDIGKLALMNLRKFQAGFPDETKVLSARLVVAAGYLEEAVATAARSVGAGLIAVTSHHRQGLKRLFLGSQAELIARHANCPVLIMPDIAA